MKQFLTLGAIAVLVAACGSSSDATAPAADIVGSYTLESANGHALPASATVPLFGTVQVLAGTGTISAGGAVDVTITTTVSSDSPGSTETFEEVGKVSGSGGSYVFSFGDGTSAPATCSNGTCNVTYGGSMYLFAKQ